MQSLCLQLNLVISELLYHWKMALLLFFLLTFQAAGIQQCQLQRIYSFTSCCLYFSDQWNTYPVRCFNSCFISSLKICNKQLLTFKELITSMLKIFNSFFFKLLMIALKVMSQLAPKYYLKMFCCTIHNKVNC